MTWKYQLTVDLYKYIIVQLVNILIKLQLFQILNCKDQLGELTSACASAIWD